MTSLALPTRPSVKLLSDALVSSIIDEALELLSSFGVFVESEEAARLLVESGAHIQKSTGRVLIPVQVVESARKSAPRKVKVWDLTGTEAFTLGGDEVHFDPGSAALRIFDHKRQEEREAGTADLVRFHRLTDRLQNFHLQSTGLISSDVPAEAADAYRLFIALQWCRKPVVTGTFKMEGFAPMAEMLSTVRGGGMALREKPPAIFDACPSPPLKWSRLTAQSLIDCARTGIPSELVAMPLTGATAPVTLTGALVQHTAENLSGLAIAQCAQVGAPVIFGGSPSSFDMRTGSTPMGAIETMMLDLSYTQIGKALGLPTHAYIGLSDAKCVDTQAGIETGIGVVLAALGGINVVSGGGMIDFESCQSLEKLLIDNEICGMAYRLIDGVCQREEVMALGLFEEMGNKPDFLTHPHTLHWYRKELTSSRLIDRGNRQQWMEAGKPSLAERAHLEVERMLADPPPPVLDPSLGKELCTIMTGYASRFGLEQLPRGAER